MLTAKIFIQASGSVIEERLPVEQASQVMKSYWAWRNAPPRLKPALERRWREELMEGVVQLQGLEPACAG